MGSPPRPETAAAYDRRREDDIIMDELRPKAWAEVLNEPGSILIEVENTWEGDSIPPPPTPALRPDGMRL